MLQCFGGSTVPSLTPQIQYRNSTVNLGHMRKNRKVHCSAFFSTKSMDSISLRKNDLLIQLYRGEHKISSK